MTYKIADTVFSLTTVHGYSRSRLADYVSDGTPELGITATAADVRAERARLGQDGSDGFIEFLFVQRKLSDYLVGKDTLLFHGSALAYDGNCYIFAAPSGTGKSTHSRLWRELLGERVVMVNDDKPFIRVGDVCTVFGSPWDGKEHLSSNTSFPLRAICFLERSDVNHIEPLDAQSAIPRLLAQAYRQEAADKILRLVTKIADTVMLYRLCCNMSPDAARLSLEAMSGASAEGKTNRRVRYDL